DVNAKKLVHAKLFEQIKFAVFNNFHIITLRDFNANMDKPQLPSSQHIIDCKAVEITSQLSDHLIVIVKIENFLDIKHNRRNIPLKRIFDFNKMTDETWKLF
ncbi:11612_t:CDS:2, partial [Funneliformis geosporum]